MSLPSPLRFLLNRAALPASHFPGQRKMHLKSALATEILRSIIVLQDDSALNQDNNQAQAQAQAQAFPHQSAPAAAAAAVAFEFRHCFSEIAKRDPALVAAALQRTPVDPQNPQHGMRMNCLLQSLAGPLHSEEESWAALMRQLELALAAGKWSPQTFESMLNAIAPSVSSSAASSTTLYPPSLPSAVERYVADKLNRMTTTAARQKSNNHDKATTQQQQQQQQRQQHLELGCCVGILTALPETRQSPIMKSLADRVTSEMIIAINRRQQQKENPDDHDDDDDDDEATAAMLNLIGSVCRSFLRAHYYDQTFVAKVVEVAPPMLTKFSASKNSMNESDQQQPAVALFPTAAAVFALWSLAGFSSDGRLRTVDDEIADRKKELEVLQKLQQSSSSTASISSSREQISDNNDSEPAVAASFNSLVQLLLEDAPENDDLDLLMLLVEGLSNVRAHVHWTSAAATTTSVDDHDHHHHHANNNDNTSFTADTEEVVQNLDLLLSSVAEQCHAFLLTLQPPLTVDQVSVMLPKYFTCLKRRSKFLPPSETLERGVSAFCTHIQNHVEEMVGAETPPFFFVAHLLDHNNSNSSCSEPASSYVVESQKLCKQTVVQMLEEAREQDAPLPTLQTMRFLLECADTQTFTAPIARYLRKNFSLASEGIPLVQLSTAVQCFAVAEKLFPTDTADDEAMEEKNTFIDDTLLALERQTSYRWDLRCLMRLVASFHGIGLPTQEQRGRMTLLLSKKMAPLVDSAEIAKYSAPDAVACIDAFLFSTATTTTAATSSVVPENVHKFLAAVRADGEDDSAMLPSKWMIQNDPASTILERSLEQQKVDGILARLRRVAIDDDAAIERLCAEYCSLFSHVHPDEVRFLFEVFAERTIKQDKLLKDVLTLFVRGGFVRKVSVFTVASILNSAAQIRFAYIPLIKAMLGSITDEQWSLIDAVELELLLDGMQKLGIRVPLILMTLGEKTLQLAAALTGSQAAALIDGFNRLGFFEELVMSALLKRAAECADAMSAGTLSLLLGGPHAHRLPLTEANAAPILRRLSEKAPEIAPHFRVRVATTLRKSTSLPAELLTGPSEQLAQLTSGGDASSYQHQQRRAAVHQLPIAQLQ